MAFAEGDEVAYHQAAANTDYAERNGDFVFGVVDTAGGVDVVWSNGTFIEGINANALDKIIPNASLSLGVGRVVGIGAARSPQYYGIVVRVYQRQQAGAGDTPGYVLVRLINTNQLLEVPVAGVFVADNQ